jgi:arylsulfatase
LDGKSILPLLNGELQDKNRLCFWEHIGNKAVRKGNWKLVALHLHKWELYNIKDDPFETNNLIGEQPEKAESLLIEYEKWAEKHGVQSWPLDK